MRTASQSQTQARPQAANQSSGTAGPQRRHPQHQHAQQQHNRKSPASLQSTAQPSNHLEVGAGPSAGPSVQLSDLLGTELKLVLNTGAAPSTTTSTVQGILWCYDPSFGSLVLSVPSTASSSTSTGSSLNSCYRIVKLSSIQSVAAVSPSATTRTPLADLELKQIDFQRLREREAEAVKAEYKRIEREPPPGVSNLGKEVFEALGKTLPVRWAKLQIVVLEEVIVDPPYTIEAVKSNNPTRMERVVKVLSGETEKLRRVKPELFSASS